MSQQYHGNDITTVSEIQRQFNDMEMLSSSLVNHNSFIGSPRGSLQSVHEEPDEPNDEQSIDDNDNFYQKKRYLKGKGGSLAESENSQLVKQSYKKAGVVTTSRPLAKVWPFGDALHLSRSGQVRSTVISLYQIGCHVCQGFGHSKSNCITQKKLKQISSGGPVYPIALTRAFVAVQLAARNNEKFDHTWYYGDQINLCANTWLEQQNENSGIDNLNALVESLHYEIQHLWQIRCIYCHGYGHTQSDYIDERVSKKDFIEIKKVIKKRKYAYTRVLVYCVTKQEFELSIRGFQAARDDFVKLLADFKSQRAKQQNVVEDIDNMAKIINLYEKSKPQFRQAGYSDSTTVKGMMLDQADFVKQQILQTQQFKQKIGVQQALTQQQRGVEPQQNRNGVFSEADLTDLLKRNLEEIVQNDDQVEAARPIQLKDVQDNASNQIETQSDIEPLATEKMKKLKEQAQKGKTLEAVIKGIPLISFRKFDDTPFKDPVERWEHGMFPVIALKSKNQKTNAQRINLFTIFFITSKSQFTGFEFAMGSPTLAMGMRNLAKFLQSNLNSCVKTCIFQDKDAYKQAILWSQRMIEKKQNIDAWVVRDFVDWPSKPEVQAQADPKPSVCKLKYATDMLK